MTIRLKVVRRQEEQARKIGELMQMFKVPNTNSNSYYQPIIGASSLSGNPTTVTDPKIAKTKDLFQMFCLDR